MKVSKEQMAENRARILDAASALFRERGFAGIGVADLMKAAGLTHGGFYGHFATKEELMARASERALAGSLGGWRRLVEQAPDDALRRIVRSYLSEAHRDHPEQGCTVAALGADVARQGPDVRASVTQGVDAHAELLAELMPGATAAQRERQAWFAYAALVGAVVLARALDDPAQSKAVLDAVADGVLEGCDRPAGEFASARK
jgi:TetR/AcrR family transcriptional repressor of nem operon